VHRFHFVHAAGLGLNAPFEGVETVSDRVATSLAGATAGAWDDLVDFCIRKPVTFVVISGGLEADGRAGLHGLLRFRLGLERLSESGIHTLIALAPSDRQIRRVLLDETLSQVTVFPADRPATVEIESRGVPVACVSGQSSDGNSNLDLAGFFADAAPDTALVGVVPCDVATLEPLLDGHARKASYWAVGSAEQPSRRGFSPWIVESGSLQAVRPGAEQPARGAMHVEIEGAAVLAVNHIDLDRIRYACLQLTPQHGIADALLRHQIMDGLNRLRATHAGRGVLVDIELAGNRPETGESPSAQRATLDSLLTALREETASWDPFVWCNRLSIQADGKSTAEAARARGALGHAIVQQSRALQSNPLHRSYVFANRFDPLMRRWTSEIGGEEAEQLIDDATRIALRQVAIDEGPS